MGSLAILIGFIAFILPVVIGLWVGLSGLRENGRNKANCCMAVGLGLATLLPILIALTISTRGHAETALIIMGILFLLGVVLFAIGFALHGQSIRRIHQRVSELELLTLAQATELERLRNR